jgi:hypothetical protein
VKHRKRDADVLLLSTEGLRRAKKAIEDRREQVNPEKLREIGQAYERYEVGLRSRWDSYEDAIKAAEGDRDHEPNPDRLIDCLRSNKSFADGDRDRLAIFMSKKRRRRRWPRWLADALSRTPTADDYERLAVLVAKVGRKPGRIADAPAHRAARLARELVGPGLRTDVINFATEVASDESGVEIDEEKVRELLDHPRRIRP